MNNISNTDILLLSFIIILFIVLFTYYPKIYNDDITNKKDNLQVIDTSGKFIKTNLNETNKHNQNFNENNGENLYNGINTYKDNIYYDNDGFKNELIPKYRKKFGPDSLDVYFKEPKKEIPLDYSHVCQKPGVFPPSREQKNDIPLNNIPICYLKDNKSTRLSKEIKNDKQYGITEFINNQNEFNIVKSLDKNTKELPIANINVNYLEKTNNSFISKENRVQNL